MMTTTGGTRSSKKCNEAFLFFFRQENEKKQDGLLYLNFRAKNQHQVEFWGTFGQCINDRKSKKERKNTKKM